MSSTKRPSRLRPEGGEAKVRKEFWLDPKALKRAHLT